MKSETFSMDNLCSLLIILTFADPHRSKCTQRTQNTSSNPNTIFPFGWSNDPDLSLHSTRSQTDDFLAKSLTKSTKHTRPTTDN